MQWIKIEGWWFMSKKFHAVNRKTGERWKPDKRFGRNFLVMFDSGYLGEVVQDFYTTITPLDPKFWKVVHTTREASDD